MCVYKVVTDEMYPFIMFLLYKYENNILNFIKIDDFHKTNQDIITHILSKFRNIFSELPDVSIEYKGYIENNEDNAVYTIAFVIKMFEYLKNVEIRIYYMYKIFKYSTFILNSNKNFYLKNGNFCKIVKNKTEKFKYDIENTFKSKIPYLIRKKMIDMSDNLNMLC